LAGGEAAEAAREFDQVAQLDREGRLAPLALLEGSEAHEAAGDRSASAERLEQLGRRFPDHPLSREGLVRAVRLHCYLEHWERAGAVADLLLARIKELKPLERVVAFGGKALSLVFAGQPERATDFIDRGRIVIDEARLDSAGKVPRDLAQIYFALGETRRIRAEQIQFQPLPPDFPRVLEERCQLLLDAQSAYSDAMRAYDAHWSAMAGYRVGQLYQRLHEDLLHIAPPASADDPARRQLFEGTMRLRYSVLLTKAQAMMEHISNLAARTGERSRWVLEAEKAKRKIEEAQAAEQQALAKLPYSRAELEREIERQIGLATQAHPNRSGPPTPINNR
jgi:tetratricopeptide (TPR) repeat protein